MTDRGRPVAKLVRLSDEAELDEALIRLEQAGLLHRGSGRLPASIGRSPRPDDPAASVRAAMIEERGEGW